ncbi:cyclin-dependent kinase inhibitor 1B [Perognathus longimembris pacificus]|uniref:cyclin-dependent kinase inhibitor 1B n=1 Tax=Perognathus longimembris pacificus TaxID=214514 RepID=UPI002018CA1A|nr:cyclin-dependent kinase inhibitor 1B [Perognathus longimembris pacificus]
MSDVRVSGGGSPLLERADARTPGAPKPSACRNLFGPVDHEELRRDLERHRRELEEAGRRRWNFDFQNHRPLDGRFEWQAVERGGLPEFYHRPPRAPRAPRPAPAGPDDAGDPAGPDPPEPGAAARKRPAGEGSSAQNKRVNRAEENGAGGAPDAGPVEQTPRKPRLRGQQT